MVRTRTSGDKELGDRIKTARNFESPWNNTVANAQFERKCMGTRRI